jgi:hypothetical protein
VERVINEMIGKGKGMRDRKRRRKRGVRGKVKVRVIRWKGDSEVMRRG